MVIIVILVASANLIVVLKTIHKSLDRSTVKVYQTTHLVK
jgi:hypothetical protein